MENNLQGVRLEVFADQMKQRGYYCLLPNTLHDDSISVPSSPPCSGRQGGGGCHHSFHFPICFLSSLRPKSSSGAATIVKQGVRKCLPCSSEASGGKLSNGRVDGCLDSTGPLLSISVWHPSLGHNTTLITARRVYKEPLKGRSQVARMLQGS